MIRSIVLAALLGAVLVSTGCNVRPIFGDGQAPKGPTTTMSDSGRQDLAIDISVVESAEVDLVESVLYHRASYHQHLTRLRDYYSQRGYVVKQSWADFELKGLARVKPYKYLIDAEIPSDKLSPSENIGEADVLYEEGRALMRRGGYGSGGLYNQDLMIEASGKLCSMIEQYPTSDKIDDAAYYLGEIHKDYLPDSTVIAVRWYERAWTWNPSTPHPARYKAATAYDYRLHNRARALELYHSVVRDETFDEKNVRSATRRIRQLTSE